MLLHDPGLLPRRGAVRARKGRLVRAIAQICCAPFPLAIVSSSSSAVACIACCTLAQSGPPEVRAHVLVVGWGEVKDREEVAGASEMRGRKACQSQAMLFQSASPRPSACPTEGVTAVR